MGIHENFIGGNWTEASTAAQNVNPSNTRDIVGEYARGTRDDANRAIEMAKSTFPAWSRSSPQVRYEALFGLGGLLALILWGPSLCPLVKVVTAFTVAHSLTLSLAVLDIVRLPSSVVEPLIAATLVFVAAENFFVPEITWILREKPDGTYEEEVAGKYDTFDAPVKALTSLFSEGAKEG
jgi:hypothetical protein